MLYIYDSVLEEIKRDIGDFRPERGGALLGEPGKPIVTKFIFDPSAVMTSSTYSPSRQLNETVQEVEKQEGLEYKGIIHSHPGSLDHPSDQDISELKTGLRLNKHMPFYLVPIVTINEIDQIRRSDELVLGEMKVSFYAAFSETEKGNDEISLKEMEVNIIPKSQLTKDLENLCQYVPGLRNPQVYTVSNDHQSMLAGRIEIEDLFDILLLVDVTYPACKPSILLTYQNGNQEEIQPSWSNNATFTEELKRFILSKINNDSTTTESIVPDTKSESEDESVWSNLQSIHIFEWKRYPEHQVRLTIRPRRDDKDNFFKK